MSKSEDLRLSAVLYRLAGHTYSETAEIFHASVIAIRVWVQKYSNPT
ncbi:MAG: helix-turn-helix domain-containing protein [Oscillibacter sp.]|nr:helix-turn-helix domain-containing protein [Oscillibacter sp.]